MVLLTDINQHFPVIIEKYQFINKNNDQNKPPHGVPTTTQKKLSLSNRDLRRNTI